MWFRRSEVATALGVLLLDGGSALAQDMRIEVTGSNIRRVDAETASPVQTITREDIEASGLQTISDVLRQITANNNGSISPSFTRGLSASGSAVSLRGLGPNNTLVLLNGRRLANFSLADDGHASYVDLQQIPFEAVERIEVLKDGASAIYGSDAVAGVINVILRQQYSGMSVTTTVGTNYNRQGNQAKGAVTIGAGDPTIDGYNVFVTLDAQKQEAIPANTGRRYAGTNDLRFMGLDDARPGGPTLPASFLGSVTIPGPQVIPLQGPCAAVNQDKGFCRWEPKDFVDLQPEIERFNAFTRGTLQLNPAARGYVEASFFHVDTDIRLTPRFVQPSQRWPDAATLTILPAVPIRLSAGHPDNPFGPGMAVPLVYTDRALGPVEAHYTTATQRYLVGVDGVSADWTWDVGGLYTRSTTDIAWSRLHSYDRLLQGLAGTSPFGYYRIGASAAANDPAIYDWIAPQREYRASSQATILDAKASRDLTRLQGGQLALAVGYEFRREELHNPGIPGTDTGNVVGIGYTAVSGSRSVNSIYAEVFAPLLPNLEATLAARFDSYSDSGSTLNPKVGIKWTALPGLVLRGTWETAFAAPGLYETGTTAWVDIGNVVDPVRCPALDCSTRVTTILAGNPDLQPETSTTYTLGAVWEPAPALSVTADYWNIRTRNQINLPNFKAIALNPAGFPAAHIERGNNNLPGVPDSGSILYISTPYQNTSQVFTDGFDIGAVWRLDLRDAGTITTELQWTHILNYDWTLGGTIYRYAGTQGPYQVSSGAGTPADRANLIVGWRRGSWAVTGTLRYVSDLESVTWQGAGECASALDGPDCHVASFTTLDLSAQYAGFENWKIFGSIINVFNRLAPFNPAAGYGNINYNYNWAFSGATGTQFNVGLRYAFR